MPAVRRGPVVLVTLALLGVLLTWWAAASGEPLLSPPSSSLAPREADVPPPATPPPVVPTTPPSQQPAGPGVVDLGWLLYVGLAVLAVLVALLVKALLGRSPVFEPPEPPVDELAELVTATAERAQAAALAEGEPRDAVIACWVALENGVERAGLTRSPAQTSEELAVEVLARWQVDRRVITRLAGLYREARFSRHRMTEEQRAEAVAALGQIHRELRAAASAHVDPPPSEQVPRP